MAQGKRCGHMIKGAMGDMFNSINRPLPPERIQILRQEKASFLREVRRMVFAGRMGPLAGTLWPYDKKSLCRLRNLYDRLHRPERIITSGLSLY